MHTYIHTFNTNGDKCVNIENAFVYYCQIIDTNIIIIIKNIIIKYFRHRLSIHYILTMGVFLLTCVGLLNVVLSNYLHVNMYFKNSSIINTL